MTQTELDHLVALKKAKKKLITLKQAAEELGITERHVRRLLRQLNRRGDKAVAHGLRGLPSNRKISVNVEQDAVAILSRQVYRGFGPTLASEYLAKEHGIDVSRETVRHWMIQAKLWRARSGPGEVSLFAPGLVRPPKYPEPCPSSTERLGSTRAGHCLAWAPSVWRMGVIGDLVGRRWGLWSSSSRAGIWTHARARLWG